MSEITRPTPGHFCWFEVVTPNLDVARRTWGELFGWAFKDAPMADGTPYALAQIQGKNVCGLTVLSGAAKELKAPPHLLSYVAVEDLSAKVKLAVSLGARVLLPALDAGPGRMAIIEDPTGAALALWQQSRSMGWLYGDPGALCWNELLTNKPRQAATFYGKLFGWTAYEQPFGEMTYTLLKDGETQVGGLMAMPKAEHGVPSAWVCYLHVPDTDLAVSRLLQLGGRVLGPPMDVDTVGRMAMLQDSQGAIFSVLQPAPQ